MADVQMKIVDGPDTGREFEIGGTLVIGRDPSAGLVIQDPEASRRHASISASAGAVEISDLQSTNGTFVNGERIAESRNLQAGDRVRIGVTVFEVGAAAQATRMVEAVPDAGATAVASVATPEELASRVAAEQAPPESVTEPDPAGGHSDSDDHPTVVPEPQAPSAEPVGSFGARTEAGPGAAGIPSPQPVADVGAPTTAGPGAAGVPAPTPPAGTPAPPPPPPPPPAPPPVPGAQPFGQPPPFSTPPPQGGGKPGLLRRIFRRGGS